MAENSKIQWTDHTFNPWIGCTKISPACKFCYAETFANRYGHAVWGDNGTRKRTSAQNWKKPLQWNKQAEKEGKRFRVFCCSLADVFEDHPQILQSWRDELWALISATPNLDWLLLTKRPENIKKFLPADWGEGYYNVWLGVTVEDQKTAAKRLTEFNAVHARIKFLSIEPLLGPIDFFHESMRQITWDINYYDDGDGGYTKEAELECYFDWIIIGGESGPLTKIRKLELQWVKNVIEQLENEDVKIFFKQLGRVVSHKLKLPDVNGGNFDQYPPALDWLKRREIPQNV